MMLVQYYEAAGLSGEELVARLQACSRHRLLPDPMRTPTAAPRTIEHHTPAQIWDLSIPSTPELELIREPAHTRDAKAAAPK